MAEETSRSGSIYAGNSEPVSIVLFGASGDLAKRNVKRAGQLIQLEVVDAVWYETVRQALKQTASSRG